MNQGIRRNFHKLSLGLAVVLLLLSLGWVGHEPATTRSHRQPEGGQRPARAITRAVWPASPGAVKLWPAAVAQSHGEGWVFEIFTPPPLRCDPLTKNFAVESGVRASTGVESGDLELVGVKREPFRLQLVGCFGVPGGYTAAIVRPGQPGMSLAREGHHFAEAGLTLRRIELRKVLVEHRDTWPVHEVAAFAVLEEDGTGFQVTLDSRLRKFTGNLLAEFKPLAGEGTSLELRENESVSRGPITYRVERIQLDPSEVVISKLTQDGPSPEIRTLQPGVTGALLPIGSGGGTQRGSADRVAGLITGQSNLP